MAKPHGLLCFRVGDVRTKTSIININRMRLSRYFINAVYMTIQTARRYRNAGGYYSTFGMALRFVGSHPNRR